MRLKNFADFFHGGPEEKFFHGSWLWHGKCSSSQKMTKNTKHDKKQNKQKHRDTQISQQKLQKKKKNNINSSEKYQLCRQNLEQTARTQHVRNTVAVLSQQFRNTPRYFAARSQHVRNTFATLSTHFHKTLRCFANSLLRRSCPRMTTTKSVTIFGTIS